MRNGKSNSGTRSALRLCAAAMICALSFALMYIGTLTGVGDLCAAVLGALGTAFAVIELGGAWPWIIAAACSVLCLLLLPDKFAALEYIMLGGVYPIIKSYAERLPKAAAWAVKFAYFNLMLTGCLAIAKFVLLIDESWAGFNVLVYALANAAFLIVDISLTVLISAYITRLRHRLKLKF